MSALRDFLDIEIRKARALFEMQGEVRPMFVGWDLAGTAHVVPTPWRNDADKEAMIQGLRDLFAAKGVVRYAVFFEGWALAGAAAQAAMDGTAPRPRHSPDRYEVLMIEMYDDAAGASAAMTIDRTSGKPTLSEPHIVEAGLDHWQTFSRFEGIVPRKGKPS